MSCQQYEELISLYLYAELSPAEEESVESHCASCASCAAALDRERALHAAMNQAEVEVPANLLLSCRRDLAQAVAAAPEQRPGWGALLQSWFGTGGWKPAVAFSLIALGFLGGRVGQRPAGKDFPPDTVMTRVREVAPDGDGRVRLVLEETRQRTLGGAADDERIKSLLLSAAQDPADAGVRIESVDLLRQQSSAVDVRRALMRALEHDPNPGVRLKALEGLRPFATEPDVRRLLAQRLEVDDNPGIRTQAVDVLIEHGQKDVVDVLQRLMEREDNGYIRSRSRRALEAINASVETF